MQKAICLASLVSSLLALTAVADTLSEKAVLPSVRPLEDDQWITIEGNGWLSAVDGDIGIRGLSASADMSIGEMLGDLDFAYMGYAEFGRGRWSVGLDVIYAKLSQNTHFNFGPIDGRIALDQEQAFLTARAQYRVSQSENHTLDVFSGLRWSYIDIDSDVRIALSFDRPALQQFNRERHRRFDIGSDWVDPVLGFRSVAQIHPDWSLRLEGDIGGFGSSSELTWQSIAGVAYAFRPNASLLAGYRALGMDYDRRGFRLDTVSHGPLVVFSIRL